MISKMILASGELGCSDEIITIAAVLSIQVIALYTFSSAYKSLFSLKCKKIVMTFFLSELNGCNLEYIYMQSVWVIARGVQREQDEAKLRFAAAEVNIAIKL